ncbi:hypodermin-B-like [Battus philenor]|uniref:hypodermin-B-like n=1 Tax=Battus philenor TaxID=42288 RepID=UPI0035D0C0EB
MARTWTLAGVAVLCLSVVVPGGAEVPGGHGALAEIEQFPYSAAVLRMNSYVSAGALVGDRWVITAADGLYLVRESVRLLRVRLGSVNYKTGGSLLPVQYLRLHPYFDDARPQYDVALLRLARPAAGLPRVRSVRLLKRPREITATHFIVTAWSPYYAREMRGDPLPSSVELVRRSRLLEARQAHPLDSAECRRLQHHLGLGDAPGLMCLEPMPGTDSCKRDAGAPVVLNGVLWAVESSWRGGAGAGGGAGDRRCSAGLANLLAAPNVSSWIDAVMRDLHWKLTTEIDQDNFI